MLLSTNFMQKVHEQQLVVQPLAANTATSTAEIISRKGTSPQMGLSSIEEGIR